MLPLNQLENLTTSLFSESENLRNSATRDLLEMIKVSPVIAFQSMITLLQQSKNDNAHLIAALQLRKFVLFPISYRYKKTVPQIPFFRIPPSTQKKVLETLLQLCEVSGDRNKSALADCVSSAALMMFRPDPAQDDDDVPPPNRWPEFVPWLKNKLTDNDILFRKHAFSILEDVLYDLRHSFLKNLSPIINILGNNLVENIPLQVRVAALKATTVCVSNCNETELSRFSVLSDNMLKTALSCIQKQDEYLSMDALRALMQLTHVNFMLNSMDMFSKEFGKIAGSKKFPDDIRTTTLDIFVNFAESGGSLVRKNPAFSTQFVQLCLQLMLEINHSNDWEKNILDDIHVQMSTPIYACVLISRYALAVPGAGFANYILDAARNFLTKTGSSDLVWRTKTVGCQLLSSTAEGLATWIGKSLPNIVPILVKIIKDENEHPQARHAALGCIAQFSQDFEYEFQSRYASQVLSSLVSALHCKNRRVQSLGAAATINFVDRTPEEMLTPYGADLLNGCLSVLSSPSVHARELGVSALGVISFSLGDHMASYYNKFMPVLRNQLINLTKKNSEQDFALIGKIMTAITSIGAGVGYGVFKSDYVPFISYLRENNPKKWKRGDPRISHWLFAMNQLASFIPTEIFAKQLPFIIPNLIATGKQKLNLSSHGLAALRRTKKQSSNLTFVRYTDDLVISYRTEEEGEILTAINMVASFAELCEGYFMEYVQPALEMACFRMETIDSRNLRMAAATLPPILLKVCKDYAQLPHREEKYRSHESRAFQFAWDHYVSQLTQYFDLEVTLLLLDGVSSLILVGGIQRASPKNCQTMMNILEKILQSSIIRRSLRLKKLNDPNLNYDADQYQSENEIEHKIMINCFETIGAIVQTSKQVPSFIQQFSKNTLPVIQTFLKSDNPRDRYIALMVYDDMIEHIKDISFIKDVWPQLLENVTNPDPSFRQVAIFGIGAASDVVAYYRKQLDSIRGKDVHNSVTLNLGPYGSPRSLNKSQLEEISKTITHFTRECVRDAISRMLKVFEDPNARFINSNLPTDNAVITLGKFIMKFSECIPKNKIPELLQKWFEFMPVMYDVEELPNSLWQLCFFISNPQYRSHILKSPLNQTLVRTYQEVGSQAAQASKGPDICKKYSPALIHVAKCLLNAFGSRYTRSSKGLDAKIFGICKTLPADLMEHITLYHLDSQQLEDIEAMKKKLASN